MGETLSFMFVVLLGIGTILIFRAHVDPKVPIAKPAKWVKANVCYDEANGGYLLTKEPCPDTKGAAY